MTTTDAGRALVEKWFPSRGDGLDGAEFDDFRYAVEDIEKQAAQRAIDDLLTRLPEALGHAIHNRKGQPHKNRSEPTGGYGTGVCDCDIDARQLATAIIRELRRP